MSRTKWKGPYIEKDLLKKIIDQTNFLRSEVKTFSRESFITYKFVGLTFQIYNGKTFLNLKVTEDMIGYKLGEFSPTKKKFSFKKKKKKNNGTKS